MAFRNPFNIRLPNFEYTEREGWQYCGTIHNPTVCNKTFKQLCKEELRSDHGELRAVDVFPGGAVCWCKELDW
jgi:hypothetical protein